MHKGLNWIKLLLHERSAVYMAESVRLSAVYEQAFLRCRMRDFQIHIEPSAFHAYPFFTFTPEG